MCFSNGVPQICIFFLIDCIMYIHICRLMRYSLSKIKPGFMFYVLCAEMPRKLKLSNEMESWITH